MRVSYNPHGIACYMILAEVRDATVEDDKRILDKQKALGFAKPRAFLLFLIIRIELGSILILYEEAPQNTGADGRADDAG